MFRRELPYILIESTNHEEILAKLKALDVASAHFTNGTYAFGPEITVATTLAGFKHVLADNNPDLPLIIAINSDESMRLLGKTDFKDQKTRANIVAKPLAEAFPKNKVIIMFYDEKTPNKLYELLSKNKITYSLYKWGYGTEPNAPKIEGAELFSVVYGYPLVNDTKPVCWEDTPVVDQKNIIKVADLRGKLITSDRKCLFSLPENLKDYQDSSVTNVEELVELRFTNV